MFARLTHWSSIKTKYKSFYSNYPKCNIRAFQNVTLSRNSTVNLKFSMTRPVFYPGNYKPILLQLMLRQVARSITTTTKYKQKVSNQTQGNPSGTTFRASDLNVVAILSKLDTDRLYDLLTLPINVPTVIREPDPTPVDVDINELFSVPGLTIKQANNALKNIALLGNLEKALQVYDRMKVSRSQPFLTYSGAGNNAQ